MEVENMSSRISKEEEKDDVPLPGFRFHPTDEELVGFYLRRKVDKRPIRLHLISLVDIYKFDPWDLPKSNSSSAGEKEWYFFCRRGRKYKNSIRPNRVTRSGFWKATGIDRPIYSSSNRECIGLKKSLVYYRGSAGKGIKTDWMMHEFRLPPALDKSTKHVHANYLPQEAAEVWTLCRILKRSVSYRKSVPVWKEMAPAKRSSNRNEVMDASSESCSDQKGQSTYMSLERTPVDCFSSEHQLLSMPSSASSYPIQSYMCGDLNGFFRNGDWEDLQSLVDYTNNPLYY